MKIHRFIVPGVLLPPSGGLTIAGEVAHQMKNVLKLRIGERAVICDGLGNEAEGIIHEYVPDAVVLRVEELRRVPEEARRIVLCASIIKNENFDWLCEKVVEVGVSEIIPIISERTVKTNVRPDRLERIMREAAETSARGTVPVLREPKEFRFAMSAAEGMRVFYDIGGSLEKPQVAKGETLTLFVGPEGGWADKERQFAAKYGCLIRGLTARPLRAETAAILAVYDALHF